MACRFSRFICPSSPDPQVCFLFRLEVLHLQHNAITALPTEIGMLKGLRQLSLHHNHLTALPAGLGDLGRCLEDLELNDNDLQYLPRASGWASSLLPTGASTAGEDPSAIGSR